MAKRIPLVLSVSLAFVVVGLLGAWAFNPDDGTVVHSEALWRIFGIGAYAGVAGVWLTALASPLVLIVARCRRRHAARP